MPGSRKRGAHPCAVSCCSQAGAFEAQGSRMSGQPPQHRVCSLQPEGGLAACQQCLALGELLGGLGMGRDAGVCPRCRQGWPVIGLWGVWHSRQLWCGALLGLASLRGGRSGAPLHRSRTCRAGAHRVHMCGLLQLTQQLRCLPSLRAGERAQPLPDPQASARQLHGLPGQ